jgi:DNA polymerase III delta prime subunit
VEINASDDRAANNLISKIEDIANNDTIRGNNRPALICLDEIDGVSEGEITGITKLLDYIENGKKPKPEDYPQKSTKQGITEPKQK